MEITEVFTILGVPARFAARLLISLKYVIRGYDVLRTWPSNDYANARFGKCYKWKLWLLLDVGELQQLETLLNKGSEEEVLHFRDSELEAFRLVSVVGALLAQAAISALSLPQLNATNYSAWGMFTLSLVLSLLAIFFTCVQQRHLGFLRKAVELRAWLSNGIQYENADNERVFQSSMVAHQLLQAPYELVGISITLFIGGLGVYLGSTFVQDVPLNGSDGKPVGNVGVLSAFIAGTVFGCSLFGFLLGRKDGENRAAMAETLAFEQRPGTSKGEN